MKITHIALWTSQIEEIKDFYVRFFGGQSNKKYVNVAKGFESYFITFDDGCKLEIMQRSDVQSKAIGECLGFCHIAFGYDSRDDVLAQTERMRSAGIRVVCEPRQTGDGYFESVIEDPDGNRIEITAK